MTGTWTWYWRRLKVMNVLELGHRLRGHLAMPVATRRARLAEVPQPSALGLQRVRRVNQVYRCTWQPEESIHVFDHRVPWQTVDWLQNPATGVRVDSTSPDYRNTEQIGDIKLLWELSRFKEWVVWAEAGEFTRIRRLAQSWAEQNPPFVGIQWTSALEAGLRSLLLARVLALAQTRGHTDLVTELTRLIYWNGQFIVSRLSSGSSANNHLLGEALGLYISGLVFSDTATGERWMRVGKRIFAHEYMRQTDDDGVCGEASLYYQCYIADMGLLYCLLTPDTADSLQRRVARVTDSVLWWSKWSDSLPLIGDDDGGILTPHGAAPNYYAPYAELRRLRHEVLPTLPTEASDPADFAVFDAGEAGQFFMRIGPFGMSPLYAHAHADLGALFGYRHKRALLVDPGTGRYFEQAGLRAQMRSAQAHNTVADGSCSGLMNGPFMWVRPPQTIAVKYADNHVTLKLRVGTLDLERKVTVDPDVGLRVTDFVHNPQRKLVQSTWNLAPDLVIRRHSDYLFEVGGLNVQFSPADTGDTGDTGREAGIARTAEASDTAGLGRPGLRDVPSVVKREASRRYNVWEDIPSIVRTSTLESIRWETVLTLPGADAKRL